MSDFLRKNDRMMKMVRMEEQITKKTRSLWICLFPWKQSWKMVQKWAEQKILSEFRLEGLNVEHIQCT